MHRDICTHMHRDIYLCMHGCINCNKTRLGTKRVRKGRHICLKIYIHMYLCMRARIWSKTRLGTKRVHKWCWNSNSHKYTHTHTYVYTNTAKTYTHTHSLSHIHKLIYIYIYIYIYIHTYIQIHENDTHTHILLQFQCADALAANVSMHACVVSVCAWSVLFFVFVLFSSRMRFVHLYPFPRVLLIFSAHTTIQLVYSSFQYSLLSTGHRLWLFFQNTQLMSFKVSDRPIYSTVASPTLCHGHDIMRSMRSMRGGFIFRNRGLILIRGPSLKVHPFQHLARL
jgi:hypothetical protein